MICVQLRIDLPMSDANTIARWNLAIDVLRREDATEAEQEAAAVVEAEMRKLLVAFCDAIEQYGGKARVEEIK